MFKALLGALQFVVFGALAVGMFGPCVSGFVAGSSKPGTMFMTNQRCMAYGIPTTNSERFEYITSHKTFALTDTTRGWVQLDNAMWLRSTCGTRN